ncbi:unnamed protein product [Rotaria sordida]|uniref:Uncharacterized protein n=1 Tax=Rotaria sordida TaxID=392033 RepID=A0A814G0L9_9BILA|nr:unnamed protein product [Rotaria sordida]CAF0989548.1 unnamed protein product [Rotaria sordida]
MPYAQVHYPFERCRTFQDTFSADFIVEDETTLEDCVISLNVLCYILLTIAKLMKQFTIFLAEYMYQVLGKLISQSSSSSAQDLSFYFQMIPKS